MPRCRCSTADMPATPQAWPVHRWKKGAWQHFDDDVSPEEPVLLRWAGGERLLWAWPEDLAPLCLGHVLLDCRAQAESLPEAAPLPRVHGAVRPCTPPQDSPAHYAFEVELTPVDAVLAGAGHTNTEEKLTHTDDTASDAEDTGGTDKLAQQPSHTASPHPADSLTPPDIVRRMDEFLHMQGKCPDLWASTGCFHRAALFAPASGTFLQMAEDIGRHNCLDRLAGWACLHGVDLSGVILFISARITASLYAKARRAGFRCLISRSAVTTAPVTLALRDGDNGDRVTLIGFCRPSEERFTIFAGGIGGTE